MAKSTEMAAHSRLQNTAIKYWERTGRVVTMPQLRYWGRGGKTFPRVWVYNMRNIQRFVMEQEAEREETTIIGGLPGFRYYYVVRVKGTESGEGAGNRKYDLEWVLVYFRSDARPFSPAFVIERRAARAGLEWAAWEYDSHIPDMATAVEASTEVEFVMSRGQPYYHFKDSVSIPPREFSGPLDDERLKKVMDEYYDLGA